MNETASEPSPLPLSFKNSKKFCWILKCFAAIARIPEVWGHLGFKCIVQGQWPQSDPPHSWVLITCIIVCTNKTKQLKDKLGACALLKPSIKLDVFKFLFENGRHSYLSLAY